MAELITEDQPRIKFKLNRSGNFALDAASGQLLKLCALMARMEAAGAAPVLNDGKVGGNCAMVSALAALEQSQQQQSLSAGGTASSGPLQGTCNIATNASSSSGSSQADASIIVSRSGKAPGAQLQPCDFARVAQFDQAAWAAAFESSDEELRPSSDTPLLWACLSPMACEVYGWKQRPLVAFHGHALESGAGLQAARGLGIPISEHETLFSTPEDLAELEDLFMRYPYPEHRIYVRRGHGFFVLGETVEEVEESFETILTAATAATATAAAVAAGGGAAAAAAESGLGAAS